MNDGATPPETPATLTTEESLLFRGVGSGREWVATAVFLIVPPPRARAATVIVMPAPGGNSTTRQETRWPDVLQLPRVEEADRSCSLESSTSMTLTCSAMFGPRL